MHPTDQIDYTDPLLGIDKHFEHIPKKEATSDMEAAEINSQPESINRSIHDNNKLDIINTARSIIRGQQTLNRNELNRLIAELERLDQYAYATEVLLVRMKLDESRGATITLNDYEALATYIYKDHSLPSSFKFKKALQELTSHESLRTTTRCETLSLAASIYKRKWQFDHQFNNLKLAHYYFERGFNQWKQFIQQQKDHNTVCDGNDIGYNAINYAYINELMAVDSLEQHGSITGFDEEIDSLFKEAMATRTFILNQLVKSVDNKALQLQVNTSPTVLATIAEAYFGTYQYDKALVCIREYLRQQKDKPGELRNFSQQLFALAYLQTYIKNFKEGNSTDITGKQRQEERAKNINLFKVDECLDLFRDALDTRESSKERSARQNAIVQEIKKEGKTGLGLSGGGFRAAMFHIGVLAALAEKDELKRIEVISCVSGGSIIGAYYYLKLKDLLERKSDDQINKEDYIKIVKEIELAFVSGVQRNLRMRIFSNLVSNIKMFDKNYSRSHRLGELYEEHLFKGLIHIQRSEEEKAKGLKDDEMYMSDLFIKPKGETQFSLTTDNWHREHKVPQLILNATSVNTGHNWQFTASWMGEPPDNIQTDVDVKPRLRRMYYEEAPAPYKHFRLGHAVAASSCVPVLFHPFPMYGLYPGVDLELIDGGVHDNQGIGALLEQECKNLIVSDGSGQLETNNAAVKNDGALFFRSDTILQERLRELQLLDLKQRNSTTQLNQLVTVHLKSDLENRPVSWKFCTDPPRKLVYGDVGNSDSDLTRYGLLRNVQLYLSQIRTDLDSFHDLESYALMYSGYAQIHYDYKNREDDDVGSYVGGADGQPEAWRFLQVKDYLTRPDKASEKEALFREASRVPFKLYYLSKKIKIGVLAISLALVIGLLSLVVAKNMWDYSILNITIRLLVWTAIVAMVGVVSKVLASLMNVQSFMRKNILFALSMVVGCVVCNVYLWFFNSIYNRLGRIDGAPKQKDK